jgi:hypothetical protein
MTAVPRHRQTPVSFRSDKAAALLARLTRNGQSQARVIEDALEKAAESAPKMTREEFDAQIDAIVRPLHGLEGKTYRELRAEFYDDDGLPC